YLLHYLPSSVAYWLVGVCTMFMLVAILSGVITHKRIFRDFFTFRPRKRQRAWLDAHNVLAVLALPFHLMITYTGLVFFMFTYMPLIISAVYGSGADGRQQFFDEMFSRNAVEATGIAAPLAPFEPMLAIAGRTWGDGQIRSIDVQHPGDLGARVTLTSAHVSPVSHGDRLVFSGATGEPIETPAMYRSGPIVANDLLLGLHEGLFAGTALRWLYFLSG